MHDRAWPIYRSLILGAALGVATACSEKQFSREVPPPCNGFNQTCTVNPEGNNEFNYVVTTEEAMPQKKVDLLFVVDNSDSMRPEQQKMADRFSTFVNSLSGIDWRIAITTTDLRRDQGTALAFGSPSRVILQSGEGDADQLFRQTIQRPEVGDGDERGIFASILFFEKQGLQFVRKDSHLSVVVLSDEDERSTGGVDRPLEANDQPDTYVSKVRELFGPTKTNTFHSIVIRPGDSACLAAQSAQAKKGFEGKVYAQLTQKTSGILGDICANDYGSQLASVGQTIQRQMAAMNLACAPIDGRIDVSLTPEVPGITWSLQGSQLILSEPLPPGTCISVRYACLRD